MMAHNGTKKYILTARLDHESQLYFTNLRNHYFPKKLNFLEAHLTLFHALPEDIIQELQFSISGICSIMKTITMDYDGIYFLGGGNAFSVQSPKLTIIREGLRVQFLEKLTRQDQTKNKKLHITVQNKVPLEVARSCQKEIEILTLPNSRITGFDLYEYQGGPWKWIEGFDLISDEFKDA